MGLFGWFDPTRQWPVVNGAAPDLNGKTLQFDALRFGAPIESASFLGRPKGIRSHSRFKKDLDLLYPEKGFHLRFRQGLLTDVAFQIGAGAKPLAPDGKPLTSSADRNEIVARFGEPDPRGSDEIVMQVFHGNGVISDFFLDDSGHVEEWVLYPDD
jgi:hypothetical protein